MFTLSRLAAVLFSMAQIVAPTSMAAPKSVVEPAPPQPVSQKVMVKRGASVEIPLKIHGTRSQTLAWIIRQPPLHGKLSEVRATGQEAAAVTYRPPADLRVVSDRFTFSVRSTEGISAPVDVTIAITDDAPQISAPAELNFGTLRVGSSATKALDFTNSGGGIAEGTIEMDAPWKMEGARRYKLPAGDRHVVKIVFAPDRAGNFESEVRFDSQPDRVVTLRGVAEEALAVAPAVLVLSQDAGRPLRAAACEIRNNTEEPLDVTIAASRRLIVKTPLHLEPHETAAVAVQTAETDAMPLEETIVIAAGSLAVRLPVKAAPLPALVRARPENVVFRKMNVKERVTFDNRGGMAAKVALKIGTPFSVGESSFTLGPAAEKEIAISIEPGSAAGAQGVLKVAVDGGGFEIPVEAAWAELPAIAPVPQRTPATAPAQRKREPDSDEEVIAYSGPFAATVESVTGTSATFMWKEAVPADAALRCLKRVLTADENGEIVSTFREYAACKIVQRDGANVATVEKLEPGKAYLFRIDAVGANGATTLTFAQFHTPAPPQRESWFSLVNALFALALIAGGISVWQRTRSRSGF